MEYVPVALLLGIALLGNNYRKVLRSHSRECYVPAFDELWTSLSFPREKWRWEQTSACHSERVESRYSTHLAANHHHVCHWFDRHLHHEPKQVTSCPTVSGEVEYARPHQPFERSAIPQEWGWTPMLLQRSWRQNSWIGLWWCLYNKQSKAALSEKTWFYGFFSK